MFHRALTTNHFTKGDKGVSLSQGRENIIKSKLYAEQEGAYYLKSNIEKSVFTFS